MLLYCFPCKHKDKWVGGVEEDADGGSVRGMGRDERDWESIAFEMIKILHWKNKMSPPPHSLKRTEKWGLATFQSTVEKCPEQDRTLDPELTKEYSNYFTMKDCGDTSIISSLYINTPTDI